MNKSDAEERELKDPKDSSFESECDDFYESEDDVVGKILVRNDFSPNFSVYTCLGERKGGQPTNLAIYLSAS